MAPVNLKDIKLLLQWQSQRLMNSLEAAQRHFDKPAFFQIFSEMTPEMGLALPQQRRHVR